MRHVYLCNHEGDYCYTSGNLLFSAQWLAKYVNTFKLPVVLCSKNSILGVSHVKDLESQIQYEGKEHDQPLVKKAIERKNALAIELHQIDSVLKKIAMDHHYSFIGSVS